MQTLTMGNREMEFGGKYLGELRASNDIIDDVPALHARMEDEGYLLLRGLQDRDKVKAARRVILENLDANNQLDRDHPLDEGVAAKDGKGGFLGGRKATTHTPEFLGVVESPPIMNFFERYLDGAVLTYDYKWLRAVAPGSFTGAHYDVVYMGRGTLNVFTCWTPLGDISYANGPLAILVGSHRFDRVKQTYGKMDVDRDHVDGWFSNDPIELIDRYGGQWRTTQFQMGDVLLFSMFTMHASINNTTDRYRISCDTRYQRADEPVDERWIGENPKAHYAWQNGNMVSMEDMRAKWGV